MMKRHIENFSFNSTILFCYSIRFHVVFFDRKKIITSMKRDPRLIINIAHFNHYERSSGSIIEREPLLWSRNRARRGLELGEMRDLNDALPCY